jgi:uncharacterized protein (DUF305 family)
LSYGAPATSAIAAGQSAEEALAAAEAGTAPFSVTALAAQGDAHAAAELAITNNERANAAGYAGGAAYVAMISAGASEAEALVQTGIAAARVVRLTLDGSAAEAAAEARAAITAAGGNAAQADLAAAGALHAHNLAALAFAAYEPASTAASLNNLAIAQAGIAAGVAYLANSPNAGAAIVEQAANAASSAVTTAGGNDDQASTAATAILQISPVIDVGNLSVEMAHTSATPFPTLFPTQYPTTFPTPAPTSSPTPSPTASPTFNPTPSPTPYCPVTCELDDGQFKDRDIYAYRHSHGNLMNRTFHDLANATSEVHEQKPYLAGCDLMNDGVTVNPTLRQMHHGCNWRYRRSRRVVATHNTMIINEYDSTSKHRCYVFNDKCVCECLDDELDFQDGSQQGKSAGLFGEVDGGVIGKFGMDAFYQETPNGIYDATHGRSDTEHTMGHRGTLYPTPFPSVTTGTRMPTSYPTPWNAPAYKPSKNEIQGLRECCERQLTFGLEDLLPSFNETGPLRCANLGDHSDEQIQGRILALRPAVTNKQIINWLKRNDCYEGDSRLTNEIHFKSTTAQEHHEAYLENGISINSAGNMMDGYGMNFGCGNKTCWSTKKFLKANMKMRSAMQLDFTCDESVDFARAMISQHEGAIEMCEILMNTEMHQQTVIPELNNTCKAITKTQKVEVTLMNAYLAVRNKLATNKCTTAQLQENSMGCGDMNCPSTQSAIADFTKMHQAMALSFTCDVNVDFARGMIAHHQGAIDMCNSLKTARGSAFDDSDLASMDHMCQSHIIPFQVVEIGIMNEYLREAGKSPTAPCA